MHCYKWHFVFFLEMFLQNLVFVSITLLPSVASPKFNIWRKDFVVSWFWSASLCNRQISIEFVAAATFNHHHHHHRCHISSLCWRDAVFVICFSFLSKTVEERIKSKQENSAKLELPIDILCHWICIQLAGPRNVCSCISKSGHHKHCWWWCYIIMQSLDRKL